MLSEEQKELISSKDKFFSIMAHDLRSPFTGLIGFTQLLKDDAATLERGEITQYADHIYSSAKTVLDLLNNLLQWGRMQTGSMKPALQRENLYAKINESILLLINNSEKKEISVENNINDGLFVLADNFMFDSIMQNLLTNAIKFTPRKGVIKVSADIADGMVYISVSDNGVGIPKNTLDTIFKIDQRSSTKGTEDEPGTGLGIILCKEMVESQGGKFEIISEVNKGTTIKFSLAITEE
jgi:signal transduction histidine kinase